MNTIADNHIQLEPTYLSKINVSIHYMYTAGTSFSKQFYRFATADSLIFK